MTSPDTAFQAIRLHKDNDSLSASLDELNAFVRRLYGAVRHVEHLSRGDLPEGEVELRVLYSSMNYKDALIISGKGGNVAGYPHVPGIDLAGIVEASGVPGFAAGDLVAGTGRGLGEGLWGGYTQRTRLPADRLVKLPQGVTARQSMVLGTAGVTAMLAILEIEKAGLAPGDGPVLVTGAGGAVGSLSVALLSALGWEVVALEKRDERELLEGLGASRVLGLQEFGEMTAKKPLGEAAWAAAVDTVGGEVLAAVLRSSRYGACIAACGMLAGFDVPVTLHPFFARAVRLIGIDSVTCPDALRAKVWERLVPLAATAERTASVEEIALAEVPERFSAFLEGKARARLLVQVSPG